ncbi:hypothetical protein Sphch_1475 [Sphingobium chlorophenolicum L-1]|uniref:DUF5681 domain-containing protein n=1 Tax=Sphingobium chlorophenolicum L-1 TaxID=690566 RepID=F6EY57_SPHCR|nr:DUF5681 domain-containing protein [Sphingobium chlorophenolicum]AEG49163.1 hypothetical protein Sphch_1475 [Sphingobium chlorophenolicum L-1]
MADKNDKGRRQDGRPYAEGNVGDDGSYLVGKARPPEATRFAKGDNRPRGRRPKGTRNLATEWDEELREKVTVTENGLKKRHSKLRAIVKATTARAMKGSDRAAEMAFRHAPAEVRSEQVSMSDSAIIAAWVAQNYGTQPAISDDHDTPDDGGDGDAD